MQKKRILAMMALKLAMVELAMRTIVGILYSFIGPGEGTGQGRFCLSIALRKGLRIDEHGLALLAWFLMSAYLKNSGVCIFDENHTVSTQEDRKSGCDLWDLHSVGIHSRISNQTFESSSKINIFLVFDLDWISLYNSYLTFNNFI